MRIRFKSTETFLINSFLDKDVREAELLFVFILKVQRGLDREERERDGGRARKISSTYGLIPQTTAAVKTEPGQSQEPNTQFRSLMSVARIQVVVPSSAASQRFACT